jgi:hypothetical protein
MPDEEGYRPTRRNPRRGGIPDEEESPTRGKVLDEEGPTRSDGEEGITQYCLPEKGMRYSQFFAIN